MSLSDSHHAAERLPVTRGRCAVLGGEVSYEVSGEGPPLLFIMGYLARGSGWTMQRQALEGAFTVLTFDHLGVGDSIGDSPSSMDDFVEVCLSLLATVGWKSAHVIGVSMGGMIAQHLALKHPQLVRSLSLIVTHAGGLRSLLLPWQGLPYFFKVQFARTALNRHKALARLLIPPSRLEILDEADVLQHIERDFTPRPSRQVRLAQLRAVMKHKTAHLLHQLKHPTLLISADKDLLVSPKHQRKLHSFIPHATLIRYPEAGHGLIRQPDLDLSEQIRTHVLGAEQARLNG